MLGVSESHLPPLVITSIGHMKNVSVVEAKTSAGKTVILVRIVFEQSSHIERPLGAGPDQGARDVLLELVQPRLVPVVLVRFVLNTKLDNAAGSLQNLSQKHCHEIVGMSQHF